MTGQDIREAMSDYRIKGFLWFGELKNILNNNIQGWWIMPLSESGITKVDRADSIYLGKNAEEAVDKIRDM